jgi:hypothetical protein
MAVMRNVTYAVLNRLWNDERDWNLRTPSKVTNFVPRPLEYKSRATWPTSTLVKYAFQDRVSTSDALGCRSCNDTTVCTGYSEYYDPRLHTPLLLILFIYRYLVVHLTSSVGIATRYGMDGPGIESQWGRDFPHPSRPDLGPTQPLVAAAWHWPTTPIYRRG